MSKVTVKALYTKTVHEQESHAQKYAVAIAILSVAIATSLKLLLNSLFNIESPFLMYFAAVICSNLYGGWRAGAAAAILSSLVIDYLFLTPTLTLMLSSWGQVARLGIFLGESFLLTRIVALMQRTANRLRLSQQKISESEELYRSLVEAVEDYAIFMLDPDGYVVSWNKGAERLKGYQANEVIGQHFSRFYPPEDSQRELLKAALQTAANTGRVETEGWHVRKNGSRFWANVLITALRDATGNLKGFSNVTRDLTATKQYETELELERSRLKNVLQQMPIGVIISEAATGKMVFGNEEMERIFRHDFIPVENIEQYRQYKSFHPDGRPYEPAETVMARTITQGEAIQNEEISILRGDGSWGTLLVSSTPLYDATGQLEEGVVAFLDITERKQAQKQLANLNNILEQRLIDLRESEERFRATFDRAAVGIAHFSLEGHIQLANQTLCHILGYSTTELLNLTLVDITHPEDLEADLDNMQRMLNNEIPSYAMEKRYLRKDGSIVWGHLTRSLVRDTSGVPKIVIGVVEDISDRKQYAEALQSKNRQITSIFESITDGFVTVNQHWQYTYINPNGEKLIGKKQSELLGNTVWEVFPELVDSPTYQYLQNSFSEQITLEYEEFFSVFNKWFNVRIYPSPEGLSIYFVDTTKRKQAEIALQESEELFRVALDNIPNTFIIYDAHLRFQFVNAEGRRRAKKSLEEFIGHTDEELLAPEITDTYLPYLKQALETRTVQNLECTHSLPGVGEHTVLVNYVPLLNDQGNVYRILGITYDISDRKRFEEFLATKNREITNILDSITDGFANIDNQWCYTYVNPKAEEILGKSRDELLGNNVWELFPAAIGLPGYYYCYQAVNEQITIEYQEFHPFLNKWLDVRLYPSTEGLTLYFQNITERKQAEFALQQSNAILNAINTSTSTLIYAKDLAGRILLANPAVLAALDKSEAEVIGKTDSEFIDNSEQAEQIAANDRLVMETGQLIVYEETVDFAIGRRTYLSTKSPYRDPEGNLIGLIGISTDISDRKHSELALQQSEERFRSAILSAPLPIMIHNETGEILTVNAAWSKATGYTHEDIPTLEAWIDRAYGERKKELLDLIQHIYQQSIPFEMGELKITTKYGDSRLWHMHTAPLGQLPDGKKANIAMAVDITERHHAEKALRDSEEHFRNLADSMPQIVWTANSDGTVDYYNQRICEFNGFVPKADGTWDWQPVLHPDDEQHTLETWMRALKTGETYECEHRIKKADGQFRWHLSRGIPIKDAQNRVLKWYGTATDIHTQKQYQVEREELLQREQIARAEAEAASRMKDEFLATLSHELRTPMNAMLGWTSMLRKRKFDEATTDRALETIERNTRTLNQLIDDILDVSRIIRGKVRLNLQPLQILPVIEQAIEIIKPTAVAKDIQILVEILQADSLKVMGDANRLQQILWNLLSNAIKFTHNGGRVTVHLSTVVIEDSIPATEEQTNQLPTSHTRFVQIQVVDTGIGITAEFLPYVFDRFRQADGSITRSHGGLGLGLAIVRHLVELHGGSVEVFSAGVGQGATFTVNLPMFVERRAIERPDSKENNLNAHASNFLSLQDLQILVVDDESDVRELLTIILEDRGAKVTTAGSTREALVTLQQLSPQPHIIVSDIGMPVEDGYSLIHQIRSLPSEAGGQIPVIALTAYASHEDYQKAIAAGFQQHLAKPIDPNQLIQAIISLTKQSMMRSI